MIQSEPVPTSHSRSQNWPKANDPDDLSTYGVIVIVICLAIFVVANSVIAYLYPDIKSFWGPMVWAWRQGHYWLIGLVTLPWLITYIIVLVMYIVEMVIDSHHRQSNPPNAPK